MDNKHIDRSVVIRDLMSEQRTDVVAFAYVAIDVRGEVYWGANYAKSTSGVMSQKLEHMARNSKKFSE
jgi:hypothetical protein